MKRNNHFLFKRQLLTPLLFQDPIFLYRSASRFIAVFYWGAFWGGECSFILILERNEDRRSAPDQLHLLEFDEHPDIYIAIEYRHIYASTYR